MRLRRQSLMLLRRGRLIWPAARRVHRDPRRAGGRARPGLRGPALHQPGLPVRGPGAMGPAAARRLAGAGRAGRHHAGPGRRVRGDGRADRRDRHRHDRVRLPVPLGRAGLGQFPGRLPGWLADRVGPGLAGCGHRRGRRAGAAGREPGHPARGGPGQRHRTADPVLPGRPVRRGRRGGPGPHGDRRQHRGDQLQQPDRGRAVEPSDRARGPGLEGQRQRSLPDRVRRWLPEQRPGPGAAQDLPAVRRAALHPPAGQVLPRGAEPRVRRRRGVHRRAGHHRLQRHDGAQTVAAAGRGPGERGCPRRDCCT